MDHNWSGQRLGLRGSGRPYTRSDRKKTSLNTQTLRKTKKMSLIPLLTKIQQCPLVGKTRKMRGESRRGTSPVVKSAEVQERGRRERGASGVSRLPGTLVSRY